MAACAAIHPQDREASCILPKPEDRHQQHVALRYVEGKSQPEQVRWENTEYRSPEQFKQQAREVKRTIVEHAPVIRAAVKAHARHTDPHTSHQAADSLTPDLLREDREQVFKLFLDVGKPMIDEEMIRKAREAEIDQQDSGLRTRRKELADRGYIYDTGIRRLTARGKNAIVWAVVPHHNQIKDE